MTEMLKQVQQDVLKLLAAFVKNVILCEAHEVMPTADSYGRTCFRVLFENLSLAMRNE